MANKIRSGQTVNVPVAIPPPPISQVSIIPCTVLLQPGVALNFWAPPFSAFDQSVGDFIPRMQLPYAGNLKNLFINCSSAPAAGKAILVDIRINGVTVLSATITSGNDFANNIVDIIPVLQGDQINFKFNITAGITNEVVYATCEFEKT